MSGFFYLVVYPLKLIPCRKGNWLHVGSNPSSTTKLGQKPTAGRFTCNEVR